MDSERIVRVNTSNCKKAVRMLKDAIEAGRRDQVLEAYKYCCSNACDWDLCDLSLFDLYNGMVDQASSILFK